MNKLVYAKVGEIVRLERGATSGSWVGMLLMEDARKKRFLSLVRVTEAFGSPGERFLLYVFTRFEAPLPAVIGDAEVGQARLGNAATTYVVDSTVEVMTSFLEHCSKVRTSARLLLRDDIPENDVARFCAGSVTFWFMHAEVNALGAEQDILSRRADGHYCPQIGRRRVDIFGQQEKLCAVPGGYALSTKARD